MGAIILNINSNGNNGIAPPEIDFESDVCKVNDYELSGTAVAENGSIVVVYESPVLAGSSMPFGCGIVVDGAWVMKSEVPLGGRKFEAVLIEIKLA